ncbi:metallophosphoesterase [Allopusillimonas soli]|uniref:Metallophosphoesterase n=1 Tax=Allopusillimonas soli TaxID=659016 RepID=A0A853FDT2_9BURK|nr:metallophosphoesterase [Allopusillimonas soli]NYT39025.1 metallophosphoesterase [Allopusillimonas soli]TEA69538.1 metallophosphoesterase [Allopusillimonas soli]
MTRLSSFLRRLPVLLALVHLYTALRLCQAASFPATRLAIAGGLVLIYVLILAGFSTRRAVGKRHGDMLAWAGFLSMGFFSWLFVLTVLRDALLLAVAGVRLIWPGFPDAMLAWTDLLGWSALAVAVISSAAVLLGLFNSRRIAGITRVDIPIVGLPRALHGYTIAQLSDIHVGPTIKRSYVQAVVDRTNDLRPDVIVITGDIIDGSVARLAADVAPLAQLKAPHGVHLVTGNHEYYSGADEWVQAFRAMGLAVLMNEHRVLRRDGASLVLAGVTDYGAGAFDRTQRSDPAAALAGAPPEAALRILLAHQPRSAQAAEAAGFDLQLSGHTHGGQFWPWGYFVPLQQPFVAGLNSLGTLRIYVSRGTGYWGPPMRIGARSEITRIRLVATDN